MSEHSTEGYGEQIDSTLRLLGSATPAPGMEGRILLRLTRAEKRKAPRFFSFAQIAVAVTAAAMGGAVIIAGSVSHSRHMLPVAPGIHLPASAQAGVGAASAAHVAAHAVTAMPQDRPRSVRKTVNGRAVISAHAKRNSGVAVPKSPASTQ